MTQAYPCPASLTSVQKRAILKVALEMVKADNKIHSKEVAALNTLRRNLNLRQEELDLIHYIPLSDAVTSLRQLEGPDVKAVLDIFNSLMRIDSDIDFEENLLLAAVTVSCLPESRAWAHVLSVPDLDLELSPRQVAFLEKGYSAETHRILDDRYDNLLLSKAFGDIGLNLFYLPNVLDELGLSGHGRDNRFGILQNSMEYLMPAGDMLKVDGLRESLSTMDSEAFFKVVVSRFGLAPDAFPAEAFLLVKIRSGVVLDDENTVHNSSDFFCLDISSDVKHRILSFVSLFGDDSYLLPYEGYYRILFDCFSSESKINSEICLDGDFNFSLPGCGGKLISFESSPQARTLYLLLLRFGQEGIGQDLFQSAIDYLDSPRASGFVDGGSFDLEGFERSLLQSDGPWIDLIYNAIQIYRAISTKDGHHPRFLSYISSILSHRSTLKTYLNKGFDSIQELSDKQMYHVRFDRARNAYSLGIDRSMFLVRDGNRKAVPLIESRFWKTLR